MTDNRKTYAVDKSTLEAVGIELVIAKRECEKQLNMHTHLITEVCELSASDQEYYNEQISYLTKLINHLREITNDDLLLI